MTNKRSNYHRNKGAFSRSRGGVSDIIGNILILGITVTLFSSVLYFVVNMPPPQDQTISDFEAKQPNEIYGSNFVVNITHKGGQTLSNDTTGIYLFVNNVPHVLYVTSSNPGIGMEWNIGEVWRYVYTGYSTNDTIRLLVVAKSTNNIIWESTLAGNSTDQNTPPIIGNRGITPTPAYDKSKVQFYAVVTDLENAMDTVVVNATAIGLGTIPLSPASGNTWKSTLTYDAALSWNGKTVLFTALDKGGKSSTVQATLVVQASQSGGNGTSGPFDNYPYALLNGTYPPDATGGNGGGLAGASGTSFYYIRRVSDNVITKQFNPGEKVMVEFYSDTLQNLALENTFTMSDLSGNILTPPTSTQAFSYGGIFGTFNRYVLTFDAPTGVGEYPLRMKMKDYSGTTINVGDTIKVGSVTYPVFQFFKLNATSGLLVPTTVFNHTEIVYMRIITGSVDPSLSTVSVSDIEIADFTGKYVIKLILPASTVYPAAPVTPAPFGSLYLSKGLSPNRTADNDPAGIYTVQIDPKKAYQGWWLPRENTYSIKITTFQDSNEFFMNLCTQIAIIAPLTTTDIVASLGTGAFTWSATGASWTDSKLVWFKGGERMDQWTRTTIDDPTYDGPIGMALADMTGAGRNDLIVGYQDSTWSVVYFENQKVDGQSWIAHPIASSFDAYSGTQAIDGSTDTGIANEDASVYATQNGGFMNDAQYVGVKELVGAITTGDFDHDGVTDMAVSFVHSVTYSTANSEGSASSSNSWGMFFNRGIRIYWGSSPLDTNTILEGTNRWDGQSGNPNIANADTNPAALDLASGDFNGDGYNDLVAVYEDGTTKAWLNNFGFTTGTLQTRRTEAFGNNSLITDMPTVPGTTPWSHHDLGATPIPSPAVVVADMNSDGVPDIIRTSSTQNSVYVFYTQRNEALSFTVSPTSETGIGSRTGTYADLNKFDGTSSETLTEVAHTASSTTSGHYPTVKKALDSTTNTFVSPNKLQNQDTNYWTVTNVVSTNVMNVGNFDIPDLTGKTVTGVTLNVAYYTGSSFGTSGLIYYSTNNGATWISTGITPVTHTTAGPSTFRVSVSLGAISYSDLVNLQLRYTNVGAKTIYFDQTTLDVSYTYTDYYQLSWVYTVPNANAYPYHNLTVNASCSGSQDYLVDYSKDGTAWVNGVITITGPTQQNYSYSLPANTGTNYYIRIRNAGAAPPDAQSVKLTVLNIDHFRTPAYPAIVTWDSTAAHKLQIDIAGLGTDRISCIAVGDFGNSANTGKPDGVLDIVISTTKIGGTGAQTLFLKMQNPGGGFSTVAPQYIDTSSMTSNVGGSSALYDTQALEVGDFNGDKVSDIVLVIGFAPGKSGGTASSIWLYMNNANTNTLQFTEQSLNMLNSGESGINVKTGEISLTFLFPVFGILLIPVAEAVISRKKKK